MLSKLGAIIKAIFGWIFRHWVFCLFFGLFIFVGVNEHPTGMRRLVELSGLIFILMCARWVPGMILSFMGVDPERGESFWQSVLSFVIMVAIIILGLYFGYILNI